MGQFVFRCSQFISRSGHFIFGMGQFISGFISDLVDPFYKIRFCLYFWNENAIF